MYLVRYYIKSAFAQLTNKVRKDYDSNKSESYYEIGTFFKCASGQRSSYCKMHRNSYTIYLLLDSSIASYTMPEKKRRSLTKKEWTFYIGILGGFSVFYFAVYLPYIISKLPPDYQLAKFDFPENKWFNARNVTIIDYARFLQLPITNDELTYTIKYENKMPENLAISPQLEIVYGGKTVQKITSDTVTISKHESHMQRIVFYSNNTGLNQIRLNVRIVNVANNNQIIDTVSQTFNIRLYSQGDIFQAQLSELTNLGLFFSVGASVFTIVPSLLGSRLSKKQAQGEIDESDEILRPWIGVEGLSLDENQDFCRLHYHNYGRLPASSAKYKFKVSSDPISFQDLQKMNYDGLVSRNIIFPSFDNTALIRVDKTVADDARKGVGKLFMGVLIEYHFGNEKLGKYAGIFEYNSEHKQFRVVDQQIDEM